MELQTLARHFDRSASTPLTQCGDGGGQEDYKLKEHNNTLYNAHTYTLYIYYHLLCVPKCLSVFAHEAQASIEDIGKMQMLPPLVSLVLTTRMVNEVWLFSIINTTTTAITKDKKVKKVS